MIASVNLDVSIVNVTNESVAGRRRKGRERVRGERARHTCMGRTEEELQRCQRKKKEKGEEVRKKDLFLVSAKSQGGMVWQG